MVFGSLFFIGLAAARFFEASSRRASAVGIRFLREGCWLATLRANCSPFPTSELSSGRHYSLAGIQTSPTLG